MIMSIGCCAFIVMVKVFVHEVIVGILGHHDVVGCYDVNVLAEI